eukprot:1821644-Pyramimonas_sp.AAC.1
MARAVWRQDSRLAHRPCGSPPLARRFMGITDRGMVYITDEDTFRTQAMDSNQRRFDAIAQHAARASRPGRRRQQLPQGDGSPAGVPEAVKTQVTSMRQAL